MSRDVRGQVIDTKTWGGTRMAEVTVLVSLDEIDGVKITDEVILNLKEA